jgi:hypothetical protein
MKSFTEYITELTNIHNDYINWDAAAKKRGLQVKKLTHPSGVGHHFVAMDKEGNRRGHYDPQAQSGKLHD